MQAFERMRNPNASELVRLECLFIVVIVVFCCFRRCLGAIL